MNQENPSKNILFSWNVKTATICGEEANECVAGSGEPIVIPIPDRKPYDPHFIDTLTEDEKQAFYDNRGNDAHFVSEAAPKVGKYGFFIKGITEIEGFAKESE